jgi:hypothetical protein
VISGFPREVTEKGAILGYYAASDGNFLPTFRVNLSVQSSGFKNSKKCCPEMLVRNYHSSLRNNPEEAPFPEITMAVINTSVLRFVA